MVSRMYCKTVTPAQPRVYKAELYGLAPLGIQGNAAFTNFFP